ncbi:MAG: alpha/beta-hydrolase family protein [Pseudomonadota bacterium]
MQRQLNPSSQEVRIPWFSTPGIILAALFFTLSLTPSLLPRDPVLQGVLGGTLAAIGHLLGMFFDWLWRVLEIPRFKPGSRRVFRILAIVLAVGLVALGLWRAPDWQNATRTVMDLAPVESSYGLTIAGVGLGVFVVLWAVLHVVAFLFRRLGRLLGRILPQPVAILLGGAIVGWLVWALLDGVLIRRAFEAADASFEAADMLIEPNIAQPTDPVKTGSGESLVEWEEMGRRGREFVATAPTLSEIREFWPDAEMEPVRVYVGRRSANTAEGRADLALQELIRAGGFERGALVVAVPVGTGWMDPGAHDTLDFMLKGDVATVAAQYSYLTSVLSLLAHPEYGVQQARALFDTIYAYWLTLPEDSRPDLYVHGLSQGAFNSEMTLPLLDMLADPINGAMWAGSPFISPLWQYVRDNRDPDSTAWKPRFGNSSLARALNQEGGLGIDTPWGPIRLVFLNYGSDPIVGFSFPSAFRRPAWMQEPRAFDVAPEFRWYPIVTMFQLALDMAISLEVEGFGHWYIARDYIDAWAMLVEPPGWDAEREATLKQIFVARGPSF